MQSFSEWGKGCLRVIFGEHRGLSASDLVLDYKAGIKKEAEGDEEAKQAARRQFVALGEEIKACQKLEALHREGAIAIPEATRDAELLLDEKNPTNLLRQERMLELQCQLKPEQWSAWRRGKQGGPDGDPQGEKAARVLTSAPRGEAAPVDWPGGAGP